MWRKPGWWLVVLGVVVLGASCGSDKSKPAKTQCRCLKIAPTCKAGAADRERLAALAEERIAYPAACRASREAQCGRATVKRLLGCNTPVKQLAAQVIVGRQWKDLVPHLEKMVDQRWSGGRKAAIPALARLAPKRLRKRLGRLLKTRDGELYRVAVQAAADVGAVEHIPAFAKTWHGLRQRSRQSEDHDKSHVPLSRSLFYEAALLALDYTTYLQQALGAKDPKRPVNDELVAFAHHRKQTALLKAALGSPHSNIRLRAALLLANDRKGSHVPALLKLLDDNDFHNRRMAREALGKTGYRPDVNRLRARLRGKDPMEAVRSCYALALLKQKRHVSAFLHALKHKDPELRRCGAFALGHVKATQSKGALKTAQKDKDPRVRKAAQRALRQFAF